MSDYLAIVSNTYGGGSWARGPNKDDTAKRAAKFFREDWKHLFKVNSPVLVNVIDVDGYDKVWWDESGVWCGKERIDRPIEKISIPLK